MVWSARIMIVGGTVRPRSFGGPEIDDQLELGWLLDRDVGRLRTLKNEVDDFRAAPPLRAMIGPVGHETARLSEFTVAVDRRQAQPGRKRCNRFAR
jgi:hypothetical protein